MKAEVKKQPKGSMYEWKVTLGNTEVQFSGNKREVEQEVKKLEDEHFEQFKKDVRSADWQYCYAPCTSEAYRRGRDECNKVSSNARNWGGRYEEYLDKFWAEKWGR